MVIQRYIIAFIIGLIFISQPALANPIASIDRSVIAIDDTLTLTIRINDTGSFRGPNLNPLDGTFRILGNSQSSRHMIRNGRSESSTEWIITLAPQLIGRLTIPALDVDGEKTQPITINVRPSVPVSTINLQPVFLESEVDVDSAYVQQQIIFTVRIFEAIQLDNRNFNEPKIENALIKALEQKRYQRRIQNTPYNVYELSYAVFPQQAGELVIPELLYTANEAVTRRSMFSLPGQGRPFRKGTQKHTITVKKPLATFRGRAWLPASSLKLAESWSSDPSNIRVGDSVTRTITLEAEGLLDSQLPPFEFNAIDGTKIYPDQGQAETTLEENGTRSVRVDSAAIIPTREGQVVLPEIRLRWWDTQAKKMQEAVIAASTLNVQPALAGSISNTTPLAVDHSQSVSTSTSEFTIGHSPGLLWQSATGLLTIAWLFTLWLWWRAKQRLQQLTPADAETTKVPGLTSLSERQAFKQLNQSCNSQNLNTVRDAVIQWGKTFWPDANISSLQDIQHCSGHPALNSILLQLDKQLYGTTSDNGQWNGESLLSLINIMRGNRKQQGSQKQPELAPLYK